MRAEWVGVTSRTREGRPEHIDMGGLSRLRDEPGRVYDEGNAKEGTKIFEE